MNKRLISGFGCWLLALTTHAQPNPSKITMTDLTRIRQVGSLTASPDNRHVAYALTSIEPADAKADAPAGPVPDYEYRTHIYLTDLTAPGPAKALTRGTESARQPAWSPDGRQLAFVRTVKGKGQIFVMPLDGGEAYQLTSVAAGASSPKWSPDGRRILFSVSLPMNDLLNDSLVNPGKRVPAWSLEKPGMADNTFLKPAKGVKPNPDGSLAEIRAYLAKDVEDKKAKVINRLDFQGESTTEPDPSFTHLYVVDVREGAAPKPLTRGFYSYGASEWLPGGQGVLAVTERDTLKHPDREQDNALVYVPTDGSARIVTLLAEAGRSFYAPALAPDGRTLALLSNPSQGVNFGQLTLATLTGTQVSNVQTVAFDRAAGNLTWVKLAAPKGRRAGADTYALYFTAPSNGGFPLYRLDPASRAVTQLTDFESGISDFDVAGNRLVLARTDITNPSELYAADLSGTGLVRLTTHNDWLAGRQLSRPEKRTYQNSKGQPVEYWIMKPTGLTAGRKYPLLLQMHGGPTAMWGPGEASMWHEFQYFCAQGYGVVYANPRGSGGYGLAFQRANINDWGAGPAEDVLAAATDAAREPWADTSRQVITGGSYAGYLTAWIVAHDNRFKAAFAQRGVYDLTTFMGEGNAWRLVPNYFGGYPWEKAPKASLDANSPYTFVQNIRTPLLIKHGENDLRTGVIQSEMLYKSLKILGRPVEYVRMPGGTHELSRTGNVRQRIDRMLRIYEFFERYVGEEAKGLTQH